MKHFIPSAALYLLSALLLSSCNNEEPSVPAEKVSPKNSLPPVKELVFKKLVGTWKSIESDNFERWTENPDGTYHAVAFSVKAKDTSWNEDARIYPQGDNWIFENKVKNQNNGQTVAFTSTILAEDQVQFSNPQHDFPTDVNYRFVNPNKLNAFIVGPNEKGGKDTIPFAFKRVE